MSSISTHPENVERAVATRYSRAAVEREESLCCPTSCNPALLDALPAEILEIDAPDEAPPFPCGDGQGACC